MSSPEKTESFQAGRILLLSAAHCIHDIYSSFLSPLLPLLIEKLAMSLAQAGFLSAVMQLPALLNPFIGQLADRMNLRWLVILGPMLTAIPMSCIGLAPTYGVLLLLLFSTGVSVAMFHVPAPVMIARMAGTKKGRGMSFFMTGGELARTIGPLTAVGAVALFGLEGFWPVMVVGIAASVLLYFRFRNVDLAIHSSRQSVPLRATFANMRHVLVPLTIILLARSFMHGSMTAFLPVYLQQQGGSIWLGGAGLALFEAAGVIGVLTAGSLSDYLGRRRMLLISLVGAPLAVFLFLYSGGWLRVVALLGCGFTLLSTTPVMLAMVQEHAGKSPAAANGMYMMISFLARSSVVVLIGLIADRTGLQTAYLAAGIAGLAGIPFVLMLPAGTGQRQ
jgi:FSR family fosmidomycin resistance protein-like MFS transporter